MLLYNIFNGKYQQVSSKMSISCAMKPTIALVICSNLFKIFRRLFYVRFNDFCVDLCAYMDLEASRNIAVSRAHMVQSHICG